MRPRLWNPSCAAVRAAVTLQHRLAAPVSTFDPSMENVLPVSKPHDKSLCVRVITAVIIGTLISGSV
jgi:hypothetical protein